MWSCCVFSGLTNVSFLQAIDGAKSAHFQVIWRLESVSKYALGTLALPQPGKEEILQMTCIDTPLHLGGYGPQTPHSQSASGLQKGLLHANNTQITNVLMFS